MMRVGLLLGAWAVAFAVTCAVELAVVHALVRALVPARAPSRRGLTQIAVAAQVVTHPLVWLAMAALPGSQLERLVAVEVGATLVEAALYARFLQLARLDAFTLSAAANSASLLVGAALAGLI